ncbi:MAG: PilZ domain-containing protein [Rhodoferax sp.]|nr:PilZ domain-containing protein [Rhodoferax sp.]
MRTPGWANIECAGAVVQSDRLYDISRAGIALFLDIQLPRQHTYLLQLSVFRHGRVHRLDLQAHCIYSTLVGISGFRHGFHFSELDENSQDALAQILA